MKRRPSSSRQVTPDGSYEAEQLTFLRLCVQSLWRHDAIAEAKALTERASWDWDGLPDVARRGRVSPLLFSVLRDQAWVPQDLLSSLRQDYFSNAVRVMRMLHDLEEVLAALSAAGIEHMVLKGAALGEAVYHNVAVRPLTDLDMLVHREDAVEARRIVEALGYEPYYTEMWPEALIEEHKEYAFTKHADAEGAGQSSTTVDLHWRLLPDYVEGGVEALTWFWETAAPLVEGKAPTRTLGAEAQVLYLSAHLNLSHGDVSELGRLLWFADVGLLLSQVADRMDWTLLFERARAYGLVRPLKETLLRLDEAWGVEMPAAALDRLTDLPVSDQESQVEKVLTIALEATRTDHASLLTTATSLPSWPQRIRYLSHHVFPSRAYMARRYGVRSLPALPFAYLYRGTVALYHLAKVGLNYLRRGLLGRRAP